MNTSIWFLVLHCTSLYFPVLLKYRIQRSCFFPFGEYTARIFIQIKQDAISGAQSTPPTRVMTKREQKSLFFPLTSCMNGPIILISQNFVQLKKIIAKNYLQTHSFLLSYSSTSSMLANTANIIKISEQSTCQNSAFPMSSNFITSLIAQFCRSHQNS